MRAKPVPGLKAWGVDLGGGAFTIFEGVNPPTAEFIASAKKFFASMKPVMDEIMQELNSEPLDPVPS